MGVFENGEQKVSWCINVSEVFEESKKTSVAGTE